MRTTMHQVGLVREAVERQAKSQKKWLDTALLQNQYNAAMTALGEVVYELAAAGDLEGLEDFPEIGTKLQRVQDVAREIEEARRNAQAAAGPGPRAISRRTIDEASTNNPREFRVWRPVPPTSDATGQTTTTTTTTATTTAATVQTPPRRRRTVASGAGLESGGGGAIEWGADLGDSLDDDLEEYMHEDDVPGAALEDA